MMPLRDGGGVVLEQEEEEEEEPMQLQFTTLKPQQVEKQEQDYTAYYDIRVPFEPTNKFCVTVSCLMIIYNFYNL